MKLDAYNILQYQIGDYVFGYRPNTPPGSVFNLNDTFAKVISKANLSTGTSSLTPVILDSLLIPANTVKTGDVIELRGIFEKTGSLGGATYGISLNTTNASAGTAVGTLTTGTTQLFVNKFMHLCVTPSGTYVLNPATSMLNDEVVSPSISPVSLTIDWSVNQYIILTGQVINAGDSVRSLGIKAVV
jgi:hypothetical protein